MKAIWNDTILAQSEDIIILESNCYFPIDSINTDYFVPSTKHTFCSWKGEASYYSIVVNGKENSDAAWYYPNPKPAAKDILNRIAFWRGVDLIEV